MTERLNKKKKGSVMTAKLWSGFREPNALGRTRGPGEEVSVEGRVGKGFVSGERNQSG